MERKNKTRIISLSVIIAMIANPALAERQRADEVRMRQLMQQAMQTGTIQKSSSRRTGAQKVSADMSAGVVVDHSAPARNQSRLKESSNGTLVVDIAEASAAGVSHNRYQNFNVDENGLILNNSTAPVLTQLGGWTDGNRNLTGGLANIILTEVTGASRSNLLGHIEVAGQAAEFVLANQNGITCDGCGFINIPRATLVTGRANMTNGNLDGFTLGDGDFVLQGDGINTSNVDRFDIVTRMATINASLYGKKVNVLTGNDYFSYRDGVISSTENSQGSTSSGVALDVAALGGMYAQSIHLIGTEKGLGVNSEGLIQSVQQLEISADGDIRLKNAVSNQAVTIASASESVIADGQVYAPTVELIASDTITNTGMLAARDSLSLQSDHIVQQGNLYAGLAEDGSLLPEASFSLNGVNHLENSGFMYSAEDLSLSLQSLNNNNGHIVSGGGINFDVAEQIGNRAGVLQAQAGNVQLSADALDNHIGEIHAEDQFELSIDVDNGVNNSQGTLFSTEAISIQVAEGDIENSQGKIKSQRIALSAEDIVNDAGFIDAQTLSVNAGRLDNRSGVLLASDTEGSGLSLQIQGDIDNEQGSIHSAGELQLSATGGLNNTGGTISSTQGELTLSVLNDINNTHGAITAQTFTLNATDLTNTEGLLSADSFTGGLQSINNHRGSIQAQQLHIDAAQYQSAGGLLLAHGEQADLTLNIEGLISNTAGASIQTQGENFDIAAESLINNDSDILHYGHGEFNITASHTDNSDGVISSQGDIRLDISSLDNRLGVINGDALFVTADDLVNDDGQLAASDITVDAHRISNRSGLLSAANRLNLQTFSLDNVGGEISGASGVSLSFAASDALDNRNGVIVSGQDLHIDALGSLRNTGVLQSQGSFTFTADQLANDGQLRGDNVSLELHQLTNHNGGLIEAQSLSIDATDIHNVGAILSSGAGDRDFQLSVGNFFNTGLLEVYSHNLKLSDIAYETQGGRIIHHGEGRLSVATGIVFDNRTGTLYTAGSLDIRASVIDNRGGEISAGKNLGLTVNAFNNEQGLLQSGGSLTFDLSEMNNRAGRIHLFSDSDSSFTIENTLDLTDGEIISFGEGGLSLAANQVVNTRGQLSSHSDIHIQAETFLNQQGVLSAATNVTLNAEEIDNLDGEISGHSVTITTPKFANHGVVSAFSQQGEALIFYVDELINRGLLESYGVTLDLSDTHLDNRDGRLLHQGQGMLTLQQQALDNTRGQVYTAGSLSVSAQSIDNTSGEIVAEGIASLNAAQGIVNYAGVIQSQDNLTIQANELNNEAEGYVVALGQAANLNVTNLVNDSVIQAAHDLNIDAHQLINRGDVIGTGVILNANQMNNTGLISAQNLSTQAGQLLNNEEGMVQASELDILADSFVNAGTVIGYGQDASGTSLNVDTLANTGRIESYGGVLSVQARELINSQGLLLASGAQTHLAVATDAFDNRDGVIASGHDLTLDTDSFINANGEVSAAQTLLLQAAQLDNASGVISSAAELDITATSLNNTAGGLLVADEQIRANIANFNNTQGRLATSELNLTLEALHNANGLISADYFSIAADSVDNTAGLLLATNSLEASTLAVTSSLNNTAGSLQVDGGSFAISADELNNGGSGQIVHSGAGELAVTAGRINNGAESVIAGEANVQLTAATDLVNQGVIQAADNLLVDTHTFENKAGQILADGGISIRADTITNSSTNEQARGWLNANWIDITAARFVNDQYARVEASELVLSATETVNHGLLLAADELAASKLAITTDTLSNSGHIESYNGVATVQGGVIDNSGVVAQTQGQTLRLEADTLNNTGVLAGDGELTVIAEGQLHNQGEIAGTGSGAVSLSAAELINEQGLLSASTLDIQAGQLNNLAGEINANTLGITTQQLVNDTATILAANLAIEAADVINRADTDGQSYLSADTLTLSANTLNNTATVQGQQLTLDTHTLTNREGTILATGEQGESLRLLAAQVDNSGGLIEAHGEHLSIGAALTNQQGTLLHTGNGLLTLSDIDNSGGQVATQGALELDATDVNNSQQGLIQVAGTAEVSAARLHNQGGTLVAGQGLSLNVDEVQNTDGGLVLSQSTQTDDFFWSGSTWNNQYGTLEIHSADQTLQLDGFNNASGTLYHAAAGTLTLESLADWNSGDGVIVSDGDIEVQAQQRFTNSGTLAANGIEIYATEMENQFDGFINAVWMSLDAQYATNFGTVQTGQFSLRSGVLRNQATPAGDGSYEGGLLMVTSEQDNAFSLNGNSLENSAGARLQLSSANSHMDGQVINQGVVAALGEGELSFNGLVNHQGVVYSGGSITVAQGNWDNREGEVRAEGAVKVDASALNNTNGIIQAATGLNINADTLINTHGSVFSEKGIALSLQDILDNSRGAVLAESGAVTIQADTLLNERGFIEQAGQGNLVLELASVLNNTGGQINTENHLLIDSAQIINNAFAQSGEDDRQAIINAAHTTLTAEQLSNSGGYIQGQEFLSLDINQIDNRAGTLIAMGEGSGSFTLQSELLDNRNGGSLQVFQHDLSLVGLELNNTGGIIEHRGQGLFTANSESVLRNAGGVIQSAGDITLNAASIDNTDGAIAGRGVTLTAENTIHNADEGYIAGDTLNLSAQWVDNTNQGIVASVGEGEDTLSLNVDKFSNHYGTVRNSSTNWDFVFGEIDNENGTVIHTGSGLFNLDHPDTLTLTGTVASTGDIHVSASDLHSTGNLLADGDMTLDITGAVINAGQAIIRAGEALNLTVGGQIDNSGGITAFSGFDLTASGALNNSGIIVTDSQNATITASRVSNSGDIAHNGTGAFTLNTTQLDNGLLPGAAAVQSVASSQSESTNEPAGTLKTGGTLAASGVVLNNNGVISAGTLQWTDFDTLVNQSLGRIEASSIQLSGNALDNAGQVVATGVSGSMELAVATLTNRTGATLASNSQNQSFMGDVINAGSIVHAGTGVLKLGNAGVMNISGGTVSTAGTAQLSGSITGAGTVSAAKRISITGVGTFTNTGSTLYSQGDIDISAAVNNQQGVLIADGILDIDTNGTIENNNGHLQGGRVQLNASRLNNTGGGKILSTSGGSGYISVGSLNNRGGSIVANNASFSVATSGALNNTDGSIQHTGGTLTVTAGSGLNNASGKVQSVSTLRLRGGPIENDNQGVLSGAVLDINTSALTNANQARIIGTGSGTNEIIVSDLTNSATISAGGSGFNVDVANTFNNAGGTLALTGTGFLDLTFNQYQSDSDSNIRSNANLSLQTTQALGNAGDISAGGFLSVYAQSFNNASSGQVDSGNVLAIDTAGGSFSNAGTVSAAEALEVKTANFSNSGTLASDNILHLSMDTLNIGSGNIEAKGLLDIQVINSVNLGANESLVSEGSLILASEGSIFNGGTISANGDVTLTSQGLTNDVSAVISSGATAELNITGNLNNSGTIESSSNVIVNAASVQNNHSIGAGNNLELFADNITNQNNAVLYSGSSMTLGVRDTLNNYYADILSLGTIDIRGKSSGSSAHLIQNTGGTINSSTNMSLSAQSVVNSTEGVSEEYLGLTDTTEDSTYVAFQEKWGNGAETSEGQALLSGMTITEGFHPGRVPLQKDLQFYDKKLVTEKEYFTTVVRTEGKRAGLISSGGNMAFYNADVINDFGNINVGGNLTAQGAKLASFNTAKNQTDVITTTYDEYDVEFDVYENDPYTGVETFRREYRLVGHKNRNQEESVENADLKYGQINVAGNMAASFEHDISFEGSSSLDGVDERSISVNNTAQAVGRLQEKQDEYASVTGDGGRDGQRGNTNQSQRQYADQETGRDGDATAGGDKEIHVNILSRQAEDATAKQAQAQQAAASTARPTQERAEAGDDFVQQQLQDLIARYTPEPEVSAAEQAQGRDAGVDGTGAQQQALADGESTPVDGTQVDGNTEVVASNTNTEGGSQTLPAESTDQLAEFKNRAAEQGKEVVLTPGGQYVMVDPKNPEASGAQSPTGVEISTAPDNYNPEYLGGLYVENTTPEGQYLVETRPEYTEYGNFLGSDYLLNAIGYNPDKTQKRLGDAFYETQLVNQALVGQANLSFGADGVSDEARMQHLMDNAIAANGSMELAVGIALTADQAASLTDDIVWMVEEEVNGETVLVPRLYLASLSQDDMLANDSALRVGGNVYVESGGNITFNENVRSRGTMNFSADGAIDQNANLASLSGLRLTAGETLTNTGSLQADLLELTAGGDVTNLGSLGADRGLWVNSEGGSIINSSVADMVSGGTLSLTAQQDIINQQGYLEGVDVALTTELGDIVNRTEFEQLEYSTAWSQGVKTKVGEASVIVSHNSLSLDAGNNLELQGSSLSADSFVALRAGNDIQLEAIEKKSTYQSLHHDSEGSRVEYQVANIQSGGDLLVDAGRDINAEGTQFDAGGFASISAGRDINLEAVANSRHSRFDYGDLKGEREIITHTQANVIGDQGVSLKAGQDINLTGSNVISENGNIRLHAERDTNLVAVTDSEYHYSYEKKKKSFGRSETNISESMHESAAGGVIAAGGSVLINTQTSDQGLINLDSSNVNIVGGVIQADEHILVSAGDDINITGTTYQDYEYQESRSTGFGGFSSESVGAVTDTARWNSAVVDAGGSVVMDAGNNLSAIGTDISAGKDIELKAIDQVFIANGVESSSEESWKKSSGFFTSGDIYAAEESRTGETLQQVVGSNINAEGVVIVDSGSTTIVSSNIHGGAGVKITADIGDVKVLSAANTSETFSFEESKTVGLGDLVEGWGDTDGPIKNQDGRLTLTFADATYDRVETQTNATDMTGSTITSGGNVIVDAANDIMIEGSTLVAGVGADDAEQPHAIQNPNGGVIYTDTVAQSAEYQSGGQRVAQAAPSTGPENSVILSAGNNVTIKEATNTYESETKEVHGTAEMSLVVQHQAAEVVKAIEATEDARKNVKQAKKDLKNYENNLKQLQSNLGQMEADYENGVPGINYNDLLEMRELVEDVEGDKEWYQGGVVLAEADLTAKITALAQQTAAAAQSTGTYGFNAGVQLDIDASKTEETIKETTSLASNVTGQNIHIQTGVGQASAAGTNTTIQGSNVIADNALSINTGSLDVLASRDTLEIDSNSEQAHITAQMTVYGASGGASISGDYSRSKSGENHTTYNNSTLMADNMTLNTIDDATIRGGNVRAESVLNATIGGDLAVESVQNRSRTQNNSMGVSGGISLGGTADSKKDSVTNSAGQTVSNTRGQGVSDIAGLAGANGGINASNGMSVTKETVRSSLTSGGIANINVGGVTQITGATIGTTDDEGNDLGNLNLTTSELRFTDLRDIHMSNQTSGSISTSVSLSGASTTELEQGQTLAKDGEGRDMTVNTTNITYSNASEYDASNSMATLGTGNITVGGVALEENGELTEAGAAEGSVLAGLNRDTANTTKELWSIDRQEGNVDLQVDHRFFSEEGRGQIQGDLESFGENIQIISQNVPKAYEGNAFEMAIGEFLEDLNDWTYGITPSDLSGGGLIGGLPSVLGVKDNQHQPIIVMPTDDPLASGGDYDSYKIIENPNDSIVDSQAFIVESLSGSGSDTAKLNYLLKEILSDPGQRPSAGELNGLTLVIGADIDKSTATDQNSVNGMLNNPLQAIINGKQQTQSDRFNVAYNPTHGVVGDLLEAGMDKLFDRAGLQSGVSRQTGEYISNTLSARSEQYSEIGEKKDDDVYIANFALHSQANAIVNAALNNDGVRIDKLGITTKQAAGVTFMMYGSPVANESMERSVRESGFTFAGSISNDGDSVSEVLGGNQGLYLPEVKGKDLNSPLSFVERIARGINGFEGEGGIVNTLRGDKNEILDEEGNVTNNISTHSTYSCVEESKTCGNRNFSRRD
ncbi:hemagglutinin repeat-containing protein [Gilvimarinus chinensis]|uniref:two-partner secretion domain-containing protein n=1 Tax=Gilvimarinus chinensis TaxID=396005 RepID=UPI00036DC853|nr:hemagglutinin repeat-containing protein [Gilvimarinus chinensis]